MSAFGELGRFLIYIMLTIPFVLIIGLLLLKRRNYKFTHLIYLLLCSAPLLAFSYQHYNKHRQAELKYVGEYKLTNYLDCEACILVLYEDNTYTVYNKVYVVEFGEWKFRGGGDYFMVDIGKKEQLGSGKFKYIYPRDK